MAMTSKMAAVSRSRNDATSTEQNDVLVAPDQSFTKKIIHSGKGLVRPNEGSRCVVEITPAEEMNSLDETLVGYPLGDEAEIRIGDGEGDLSRIVDACLETMLPGETSMVEVAVATVKEICNSTDRESSVTLRIKLKSFERDRDIFEMTIDDKLTKASNFKAKGSRCFSLGNIRTAERFYIRALKYLITVNPVELSDETDDRKAQWSALKCACLLNVAACQLKFGRFEHVVCHCTKALEIDAENTKGLFRRGVAYTELQEYERAQADLDRALRLEPNSKPLRQQRRVLEERMKRIDAKYAKAMSKMFGGR